MSDTTDLAAALNARDAELFRLISQHDFRRVVLVGFDTPTDTRDEARKQTDTALLAAIGRTHRQ